MNTEDVKEGKRPETLSEIGPNAELGSSESRMVLPSEAGEDGGGDHLPSLKTKETTSDNISVNATQNQEGNISEKSKLTLEGGDGDKVMNVAELQQDTLDSVDISNQVAFEDDSEEAHVVPPKPTFLESVSSVISEDVDSENQDEELVLKWDDDDEVEDTIVPLKDDEFDKKLEQVEEKLELLQEESKTAEKDLDQVLKTAEEKSVKITEADLDHDSEKLKDISKEFEENPEQNDDIQMEVSTDDLIDEPDLRMSEDEADDDQEDLLSEIDAQIAELGASLSKAENEKLMNTEKSVETKTTVESVSDNSEKTSTLDKVANLEEITDSNKNKEQIQENENKQKTSEMELEEALLADDKTSQTVEDCNIRPIDTTSESNKGAEMEIDAPINLEEADLLQNQNEKGVLPNNSEILANSTLFGGDNQLETSRKDNSFAHDSSGSVDDRIHGVNTPNVMLEIPTQELIDLDDSMFSSQGNDLSVDKNKTEDLNDSIDLTDDQHLNEKINTEIESDAKTEKLPSNNSVDLTDNKNQANELIEKINTEKAFDDMMKDVEVISNKDVTVAEQILSNDSKPNLEATPEIETPHVDVMNSSLSQDDTDKDLNNIEESDSGKKVDPPNSIKEENMVIIAKGTEESLSKAGECTTNDNNNTGMDIQADLPAEESMTDNGLAIDTSTEIAKDISDVQPSTSQAGLQTLDRSDDAAEVAEVTDSLGLLAECSRVREDDDGDNDGDVDDQEISDHDDYDDDFDPDDESSNQLTAEHSEDSAQHSESDMPKAQETDKQTTNTDKPFGIIESMTKETETDITDKAADEITTENQAIDQEIGEIDQITEEIDEGTAEIDQGTAEVDQITEEVDEGTVEIEQETGGKEFGFEISNVVSEDATTKEGESEIDIDDEIVCGEVEVTDNLPETDQQSEVDTSALKHLTETDKTIPLKVCTESKLRELLQRDVEDSKKKKLEIAQPSHIVNIVDLESSSEDESVQKPATEAKDKDGVTSINISKEIEVMSSGDNTSEIISKEGETVINVPKTIALQKIKSRLNTSEITIKTASPSESPTLVIPEAKMGESPKPKFGALEVFSLDSDEEDTPLAAPSPPAPAPAAEPEKAHNKCVNSSCTSDQNVPFFPADPATAAFYDSQKKKRAMVCQMCLYEKTQRALKLVEGIKNFTPILALEEVRIMQELVEISDSDSDEEGASDVDSRDKIGLDNIPMLERQLSEILNETWERYSMDARLHHAQDELNAHLERLEKESAEVNAMLDECQQATDKLRGDLYATFDAERHHLPAILIHDTPDKFCICPETQTMAQNEMSVKRRLSSASESQAKKPAIQPAIPLANAQTDKKDVPVKTEAPKPETDLKAADTSKLDDDKDISVVNLSAEAAPADLPPPGETVRAPLQVNQTIYAMRHAFGSWIKARVLEVTPKGSSATAPNFTMCRVKFENKTSRNAYKILPARCLAYYEPSNVRMTIGTRVIALFKDTSADKSGKRESFYSGVVAEVPNPVNKYRYLVFFDDGYAQYVSHSDTRLVCEFSTLVWEEVHPFSREFVKEYLVAYPERPMVRLHTGQSLKTEWNGKWWLSRVTQVDASLVQVYFEQDKRTEWIYRGSTRLAPLYLELQAAEKHRARIPRNRMQNKLNMPYVEYTRLDEQTDANKANEAQVRAQQEEIRRQRAVAKKSTTPANVPPVQPTGGNLDAVTSRVVYYTPKNAVKPYKMTSHTCSTKCRRTDVLALKDLRTYNPLAKPLLSGWERQIVRYKGHKEVMYRAPCGRRLRHMAELHRYLRLIGSDMAVDLFDFGPNTHCLAEFVLNKCIVGKKDLSHGKENVPVPCVNYYDDSLPEFCSYNTERTPTAGVPLCLDPEFLCGCDCTDDCQDKSKCACWKMTLEGARTIGLDSDVGYVYKRLPEPLPSGIYECNSRCKCKSTCLNRVAQHPLQLKLQVFKTLNRGWGIRALNDVPKGSFLCIYAGNLLTDATANLDGLNEGDEYLAELDYIEVVEQMKEGYEDDIPEQDKKLDRKEGQAESESDETESDEEARNSKSDADDDFEPGFIPGGFVGFNKRLRKRDKKKKEAEKNQRDKDGNKEAGEDDCITISDDEELREPSRFAAQAGMGGAFISKYRSVRTLFGKDEACYIMDAKVQGNIGRYLNHSCSPNVFVQNVFVDTHDPRFPWVAFFALTHIRAGTELTWNYNYDVGSVPGKALYCYCGAPNCRGRLL